MARILVVEDDAKMRAAVGLALEALGHTVELAVDGRQALQTYDGSFDLVLADVYMPRMNGIELMIRLSHDFPGTRLLVMSGGGRVTKSEILRDAELLGAVATLEKPFNLKRLREAVDAAMAGPLDAPPPDEPDGPGTTGTA